MAPSSNGSEGFFVPKTYEELQKHYGRHIQKLLTKYNKVESNFEDLHSYIWVKILEARVLERFNAYLDRQIPKHVTALGACDFLGVSWKQWTAAQTSWHKHRHGPRMPTPINIEEFRVKKQFGYTSRDALFAFRDVVRLTFYKPPFDKWGREIDSEGNVIAEDRPEGFAKYPIVKGTASQFRNYLSKAILNHYANFCRTAKRRHKERPHVVGANQREDTPFWESTIPDTLHSSAETIFAVTEARGQLSAALVACLQGSGSTKAPSEHESEIFSRLTEGATLVQALKETELPPRIRKQVLRAVRPDSTQARALELLSRASGDDDSYCSFGAGFERAP